MLNVFDGGDARNPFERAVQMIRAAVKQIRNRLQLKGFLVVRVDVVRYLIHPFLIGQKRMGRLASFAGTKVCGQRLLRVMWITITHVGANAFQTRSFRVWMYAKYGNMTLTL